MESGESAGDIPVKAMTSTPALKRGIDWSARYRATNADVKRYSRFVAIMKRTLPMAAAALLAAVIAYSLQPRQLGSKKIALTFHGVDFLKGDLMMTKPKLTGVDSKGNPFVVTADRAIQDPRDSTQARLEQVEADLTLKGGTWLNASATHGQLNASVAPGHGKAKQAQILIVSGAVDVYSDNGYEVHTSAATIDMSNGVISGDRPLSGQGPLGTFRADRFRIERDKRIVTLTGNVRMTIFHHGAKNRESKKL